MKNSAITAQIVPLFIESIWNNREFNRLREFVHSDFVDHSLPPALSPDMEGMKQWIIATGLSFEHRTIIEDQVTEQEKVIIKIRMELKHVGTWRDIPATGKEVTAIGYRFYKVRNGKIIEHHALIDGQAIENQLREAEKGCKVQK